MLEMLIQSVGSQPLPPYNHYFATTLLHLSSCLNLSSDVAISCNSCVSFLLSCLLSVNLHHGISHHLMLPLPPPPFFEIFAVCVSVDIHSPGVYILTVDWRNVANSNNKQIINKQILTVTEPASSPLYIILSFTHICSPHCSPSNSFSLFTHFRVLPPFLCTLENEWAGKWCHIVPIQAQWRVCNFPLE